MPWSQLLATAQAEVESIIGSLPEDLRARAAVLPVTFESRPGPELVRDGIEADSLGLFFGPSFSDEESSLLPPQIVLFLDNLWEASEEDVETFREEVRITLLHELGHYLGLDEDDLTERGLD
jgi:predicted Zn-dependent protease with MMP-like domain